MNHDEKMKLIQAMKRYGGGFVQKLAEAMVYADARNLQRIIDAFPDYVRKYSSSEYQK